MKLSVYGLIAWIIAVITKSAPVSTTSFDVTGQPFESICGDIGTFVSGVFHQGFRSECTTPNPDGTFTCRLDSFFNFSNAEFSVDGVVWNIVEASHSTSILTIGPEESSTVQRRILVAQAIQPGTGVVRRLFGNLKCQTVNGVSDCKVDTFIMEC
jgi:hypothetical protein